MSTSRSDIFARTVETFLRPVLDPLRDPSVSEIMINGPADIYVERFGRVTRLAARFDSHEALMAAIRNVLQFSGKRITPESPLIDARLPDGSRVHVALEPVSLQGPCMCIRKFGKELLNMQALIDAGAMTPEAAEFLRLAVRAEQNLIVAGGTSSGKTTLLNALSTAIPNDQRIVVIEDSSELQLQQEHVLRMETRPPDRYGRGEVTIRDLFRSSLRLRPDRIVIGEVRGGEALDMIQAMTSGHGGSMSTLHATTPRDALNRLETLAMMARVDLPLFALRAQVASAIDLIVQVARLVDGTRRVTQISEVLPLENDEYRTTDLFTLDGATVEAAPAAAPSGADAGPRRDIRLKWTGEKPRFRHEPTARFLLDEAKLCREMFL
ncbi:MAG: CpaF family protein [Phycisphaerae bacterium]|nr:CpaF family protein [Phycisphaerae bacterium]NUQ45980.1 CpaF family protein [Phycisphaerae bacterium]